MKYKIVMPFIAVALTVFVAVSSAFVCYGIFESKDAAEAEAYTIDDYKSKNIFISVQSNETNTLDSNVIACFNPKDLTVKTITIPLDTRVKIATSDQMFKDVINIGGVQMLREVLDSVVPISIDYHLIIKDTDLNSSGSDFLSVIQSVVSSGLWEQDDLAEYLKQILSLSNTDLTLIKINEYSHFLNKFLNHTNESYMLPGSRISVADRIFYAIDVNSTNELINSKIIN